MDFEKIQQQINQMHQTDSEAQETSPVEPGDSSIIQSPPIVRPKLQGPPERKRLDPFLIALGSAVVLYFLWVGAASIFLDLFGITSLFLLLGPPIIATFAIATLDYATMPEIRKIIGVILVYLFLGRYTTLFIVHTTYEENFLQIMMDGAVTQGFYEREQEIARDFSDWEIDEFDQEEVLDFLEEQRGEDGLGKPGLMTFAFQEHKPAENFQLFKTYGLPRLQKLENESLSFSEWKNQVREMIQEVSYARSSNILYQPWLVLYFRGSLELGCFILGLGGALRSLARSYRNITPAKDSTEE